jgi:hypothetical protein
MTFCQNSHINCSTRKWAMPKLKLSFFEFTPNITRKYNLLDLIRISDDFEIIYLCIQILLPKLSYANKWKTIEELFFQNFSN